MFRRPLFLLFLVTVTLFLAGLIVTDGLPLLRGPAPDTSEWHWPYLLRPQTRWWLPVVLAAALWLFSIGWLRQPSRRRSTAIGLAGLVMGSLFLQLGLVYADRPQVTAELVDRTLSHLSNGYFAEAANTTDLNTLLRHFPQRMPAFDSEHLRTHPPGLIVAQWLTIQAGAAASPLAPLIYPLRCTDLWLYGQPPATVGALAIWSFLPLVAAAFTSVPIYFLSLRLYDEAVARLAALFTTFLPALLLFTPTPDQIFALLTACTLLLWLVAVQRRSAPHAFFAGLLLSISTFLSLGNMALILVLAIYALGHFVSHAPGNRALAHQKGTEERRESRLRLWLGLGVKEIPWLVWFALGLGSVWLIYWAGWGVAPWSVARVGLQQHYELVTNWRRYDWWVVHNLVDVFIFVGPIIVVGFAAALLTTIRSLILPKVATTKLTVGSNLRKDNSTGLILALALLILALDLSGSARGEVGRLWLFFMPLLAVIAAGQHFSRSALTPHPSPLTPHPSALSTQYSALLLAAQLILVLSIGLAWRPVEAVIVVAERPQMPTTIPTHDVTVPFGETIQLTGYDWDATEAGPGGVLKVTLYWQAEGAAARPYTVFTHLINQNGDLVAQKDNWPVNGLWPPTCWQPGEVVVDPYIIPLPSDLPAGTYSLMVGLYDADTNTRLLTPNGQDALQLDNNIMITK